MAAKDFQYRPKISLEEDIRNFVQWYLHNIILRKNIRKHLMSIG